MNRARSKMRNSRRWTASSVSTYPRTRTRTHGKPDSICDKDESCSKQDEEFKEMDCFECKYNPWDEWGSCEKDPWGTCVKHRKRDVVKMPDYETAKFNEHGDYCQCQWDTESCPEEQCAR